jgi:hypothetical protein
MDTSQYTELERIKIKIKALAAKTVEAGATEEEALAAMNVVGRLLTQYNLTMNELDVRDATYRTIHMEIGRQKRHPIDHTIPALAAFTGTKTWFHKRWGTNADSTYAFFGQDQDLVMVEYLYKLIMSAMESELAAFKLTDEYRYIGDNGRRPAGMRASAAISFQRGMGSRLAARLMDMKRANDAELKARAATGTALIVLKGKLTEEAFKRDVGMKLRTVRTGYKVGNYGAFAAGHAAGDRVNLSRPIGRGHAVRGLLK